jgi:Domain of unknown function (DUF4968)
MLNFTHGRSTRPVRCLQIAAVILMVSGTALAEWESIGNLKPAGRKANEFSFSNARVTVDIKVLAPDLIRVRAIHAASLPSDHSYDVVKSDWPSGKIDFSSDGKQQKIRTEQLEVRVQLSPFRVAFYDAKRDLISKDSDFQGIG